MNGLPLQVAVFPRTHGKHTRFISEEHNIVLLAWNLHTRWDLCDCKHRLDHCTYQSILGEEFEQTKQPMIVFVPFVQWLSIHINDPQRVGLKCWGHAASVCPLARTTKVRWSLCVCLHCPPPSFVHPCGVRRCGRRNAGFLFGSVTAGNIAFTSWPL